MIIPTSFLNNYANKTKNKVKKKNTLVSRNAVDKKNLQAGGRKFIVFKQFHGIFKLTFTLKELL